MGSIRAIMSGCTQTAKPLIAILMAVYEPRLDWLREQLESLEKQTYPNLRLYVRDDGSPTVPFEEIAGLVRECIQSFPYEIQRNEKNVGSNATFERLTAEAEGAYFAYCDQDDVWLPEKLTVLQKELERTGALLVCSDMYIIDGQGRQTADSITKIRRRHVFHSGGDLTEGLLISNFVTGCTMLVRSKVAKDAIPFCPYMVHDHYIALCCSARGEIYSVLRPLIHYRVHESNQTGVMAGVQDKASYRRERIDLPLHKFQWLGQHFPYREEFQDEISLRKEWMYARQSNWNRHGGAGVVWRCRNLSPLASLFELSARWLPERVLMWVIHLMQKNVI